MMITSLFFSFCFEILLLARIEKDGIASSNPHGPDL